MLCPETLLRNPHIDIGKKNNIKYMQTVFLQIASAFYESNLL